MMQSLQPRGHTRELFATRDWRPRMEARQAELRIVSGGQTGVDRAALDAALALGLAVGGWCPRGRRAEDGEIPARYPLAETESERYPVRTRLNVTDSDATLVLTRGSFDSGTKLTAQIAQRSRKPVLVVELDAADALERTRAWLAEVEPRVLNVAGPRESKQPGIYGRAYAFLSRLLKRDS
jgi:putative molybdenum carrier protein